MKIYLNLLPEQRKQEIRRKKRFGAILREEMLFLIPIIALIFILLNVYYVITLQKNSSAAENLSKQSQEKYQQLGIYEEKFKAINTIDQKLIKIKSSHLYWRQVFQKLSAIIPDNVYISDFSTKDYKIFLVGKAKSREDLLNLKEKLETSGCFENINVPLSNLVVKSDVDFQIDITITENCLKNQQ